MEPIIKEFRKINLDKEKATRVEIKPYVNNGRLINCKIWIFKCSGVGCTKEIRAQHTLVKRHSGYCRSCSKRGVPFQAAYNELLTGTHKSGKKEITLTYKEFLEFTEINECHYCESLINWVPHTKSNNKEMPGSRSYKLDRKDNSQGYHKHNLVVCCWKCNVTKGDRYSYEDFFEMTRHFRRKVRILSEIDESYAYFYNQLRVLDGFDGDGI